MGGRLRIPGFVILVALALAAVAPSSMNRSDIQAASAEQPLPIPEGPMHVPNALTGDPYWFQQGVQGDNSAYKSVGARVTIRTVYDNVNNDAHSYWVGTILANDAFVQVGYLNEPTTTNHYYCCAWFFEYFPPGNTNSPPIIGPAGSAGPIGSWHTYSMNYNASAGVGVWSFYMDGKYLGSSPTSGQLYYLGSGATDSGTNHAPAALSEVAETTVNTDIIGPAEFKNFQYETSPSSWNDVPTGHVHWGYGATSSTSLPNPYSVAEIVGIPNDFLTGSNVPYPGPPQPGVDECGKYAQRDAVIWPVLCLNQTTTAFVFVDENGTSLIPNWISLNDSLSGQQIFYTDYANYIGLRIPSPTGQWTITQVSWHAVNIAINQNITMSNSSQTFSTLAFSTTLAVVGYIYSLPVKDATVILYLPDSTNQTSKTSDNGEAVFTQIPPSSYSLHIAVPYGITANQVHSILGPGSLVAKVFSLPELITIIVPPVFVAVLVTILAVRKEHQRQAALPIQTPSQPVPRPSFCMSCGQPLPPIGNFCAKCGTAVRTMMP